MANEIKYQANPDVSFRDEGEEGAVLYNPDIDKSTIMNATGGVIWRFIEEPKTLDEIACYLAESFSGVEPGRAWEDARIFLETLGANFINEVS
jgi:hypothetical protein